MNEIVELAMVAFAWSTRVLSMPGLIVLAILVVERGRRAAAIELAEDRKDRRVA